jgi:hypothetical protein
MQHMGDQALASARAFAAVMPPQHRDVVYFDVLGFFVVHYAFWIGWIVLAIAACLAIGAIWLSARQTAYAWGRGAAGAVLLLLVPALLLWSAGSVFDGVNHFRRLPHFEYLLAGAAALVIGAVALTLASVEQGRGRRSLVGLAAVAALIANLFGFNVVAIVLALIVAALSWFAARDSGRPAALWHATLILVLVFAVVAQALAPETAFVFAWPALLAAVVAFVRTQIPRGHWAGGLLAMLVALVLVTITAMMGAAFFTGVGVDLPAALAVIVYPVLPALLLVPGPHRLPLWAHGVVVSAGAALFAFGRWAPPDEAHPLPSMVTFVLDLDSGKAYRVAGFPTLDAWSRQALGDGMRYASLPWKDWMQWWAPAKPADVPPSAIAVRRDGDHLVITVMPPAGAYEAALQIKSAQAIASAQLDGRRLRTSWRSNSWNEIDVYKPDPRGFTVSFAPRGPGQIVLRLTTTTLAWPHDAPPLPPMPKGVMAFGPSGATQTVLYRRLGW